MKKPGLKALQIALGLCLALFILSAAVTLTLQFRPLYYLDIRLLDIPGQSGLDAGTIRQNYDALISYNSLFSRGPLTLPSLAMSESGRIHFEEVKAIFDFFGWAAILSAVLCALGIWWSRRKNARLYLKTAAIACVALPTALGLVVAVNWDFAFVAFHKLFFRNDFWLFDARTDPVITILPDTFFLHCAVMLFVLVALGSALCWLFYLRGRKKKG